MRLPKLARCILCLLLATAATLAAEDATWSFGSSRAKITPRELFWMGGFAARTRPAEGTLDDLWVKALALRPQPPDQQRERSARDDAAR